MVEVLAVVASTSGRAVAAVAMPMPYMSTPAMGAQVTSIAVSETRWQVTVGVGLGVGGEGDGGGGDGGGGLQATCILQRLLWRKRVTHRQPAVSLRSLLRTTVGKFDQSTRTSAVLA